MTARRQNRRGDARPLRERRRQARPRAWWRNPWQLAIGLGIVATGVVVFVVSGRSQAAPNLPSGEELSRIQYSITHVSDAVFDAVGTGNLPNPIKPMTSNQRLGGVDGKPQLLYIGAEYCSYCAPERWSLIAALSRFGQFGNLQPTKSASGESYSE